MYLQKDSFINRVKLNLAKKVAPFQNSTLVSFLSIDIELAKTTAVNIGNFDVFDVRITSDFSLSASNIRIKDTSFVETTTKINDLRLLYFPEVDNHKLFKLLPQHPNYCSPFSILKYPEILDLSDLLFENGFVYCNIEDCLLELDTVCESIDFYFQKPPIKGKNYTLRREKPQPTVFDDSETERNGETKDKRIKIPRQYTDKNKFDSFDVFDLIFPTLQLPLGKTFNSRILFPNELYPFQVEGVKFLFDSAFALLGDEMGLGKSIQAITALRLLFREGNIFSICVICPKAVLSDWEKKFWNWSPELKVIKIEGNKPAREVLWRTDSHVYICTYETLLRDIENTAFEKNNTIDEKGHSITCSNPLCKKTLLSPYHLHYRTQFCPHCGKQITYPNNGDIAKTYFDLIIYDEIQKTKNPQAKTTKAIRTVYSKKRWALTGTPLENKIEDLITICETIKPDIFSQTNLASNAAIISAYKCIFKRRRKEDVLKDLPPKITKEVWLELLPEQRRKYDRAEKEGIIELEGIGDKVTLHHVFALISKLKQICNYDDTTHESVKLEYLMEELDELTEQGDKALVFSQYPNETLKKISPFLEQYNPSLYDGSLSDSRRNKIVDDFENTDVSQVMLLSLKAGNSGITLVRANYVYHFDLWWNPAISAQAVGRAHRIGQKKTVFERLLLAEDTIERRIYNILNEKRLLFNEVVDGLSDTSFLQNSMTEDEIFGLFGLKKDKHSPKLSNLNNNHDISKLDPFEFEHMIGDLYKKMGYLVKVTQKSNDGGVDIYAKLPTPTRVDEVIIQCKRKENSSASVDVAKVRELYGVYSSNRQLTKAILVTNGRFTNAAKEFANQNNIELIDGAKLQDIIRRFTNIEPIKK